MFHINLNILNYIYKYIYLILCETNIKNLFIVSEFVLFKKKINTKLDDLSIFPQKLYIIP
jgi:hypothetical protein